MSLPRRYSLSTSELTSFFKTRNKRFVSPYFYAYNKQNDLGSLRLAVSLSKKRFSKATQRVKLKRLVYASWAKIPEFFSCSFDIVVVPLVSIEGASAEQLHCEFVRLFSFVKY